MRTAAVLCCVLATCTTASAAGEACRLDHQSCMMIHNEQAVGKRSAARTAKMTPGLTPYQRAMRAVESYTDHMHARVSRLPARIGAEWARMELCDALTSAGQSHTEPRC